MTKGYTQTYADYIKEFVLIAKLTQVILSLVLIAKLTQFASYYL